MSAPDDLVERLNKSLLDALILVTEQGAEIARLRAEREHLDGEIGSLALHIQRLCAESENARVEAERLRAALRECASRLESCAIIGGNSREIAALAVKEYRDRLARPTGT
jgi:chromosome segregation ATPase